jgi:hypothetical protein
METDASSPGLAEGLSSLTTVIPHYPGSGSKCNKGRKRNKSHIDYKGRNRTLFSDARIA